MTTEIPLPTLGDTYTSRDRAYESGRRIRVVGVLGGDAACETIENPRRPERIGSVTRISARTLATKWRKDGTPDAR